MSTKYRLVKTSADTFKVQHKPMGCFSFLVPWCSMYNSFANLEEAIVYFKKLVRERNFELKEKKVDEVVMTEADIYDEC